ncbi:MAG: glycoside hydrolase family 97 C-terminal domain-containing protein [Bacteroidales bacterium]|nr:glycoside hydrolase family 97 C-terminal domain-containing protein [Bacteroidales bacterium]
MQSPQFAFDFLDKDRQYIATICADGEDADYNTNPQSYMYSSVQIQIVAT